MTSKTKFEENYDIAISPLLPRINEQQWSKASATSIGGAGLSTAVVFLLTQIGLGNSALETSFFTASLGIPIWLALWQVGEAYSFFGEKSNDHFAQVKGSGLGLLLFLTGGILLLISLSTLIWHFSKLTSVAFICASIAMIVLVYKHNEAVRNSTITK